MNKGLVVGKFMPPHKGHLHLIKFAVHNCDQLIIAVCSRPNEPIPGNLRYQWMKELLKSYKNTKIVQVRADLPQAQESSRSVAKTWSKYLLKRFGEIGTIFSSEIYGNYLAEHMEANHSLFDPNRKQINVSATQIRKKPFKHWDCIPKIVQPYFVKKICIYGPESTGKTTLAKQLAEYYKTLWVPEFAREYIARQKNKFLYKDITRFARGQLKLEGQLIKKANRILFCDTDFITTAIYSKHYFGKCPDFVVGLANREKYDLYLFADIDLPWKSDPQRNLGIRRKEFKKIFQKELVSRGIPFTIISGKGRVRFRSAVKAINSFLKKFS